MKRIDVGGKKFTLATRGARLLAFFIDVLCVVGILSAFFILFDVLGSGLVPSLIRIGVLSGCLWRLGPKTEIDTGVLWLFQMGVIALFGPWAHYSLQTVLGAGAVIGACAVFSMDGFFEGQGPGKRRLSLQVLRLKDGAPCSLKDSFLRRLSSLFQPLDAFLAFGRQRQRLGDLLVGTVVVERRLGVETLQPQVPEELIETTLVEMTSRLSDARAIVAAAVDVEHRYLSAYEGAVAEARQWEDRAVIHLKAGDEAFAREALEKRNTSQRFADHYKTQYQEQQLSVGALRQLLEHLEEEMRALEAKKASILAKYRNIDAEKQLREILTEIQEHPAFETLAEIEQEAAEAEALAKASAELDIAANDAEREREFARAAQDAALEKDLAELKAKLRSR